MEAYKEAEKNIAREQAIFRAVQNLTKKRFSSTVTSKNHVRKIYEYLNKFGSKHDKEIVADLKKMK